jgi:membrane fusion protein, multidrug efflux system
MKVQVLIGKEEQYPDSGTLTFIDNTIDTATGTVKLKATFSNSDRRLWPGQFVDTLMTLTARPDAVLVPSHAVQTGQKGSYVFVIKSDLTVEARPVTTGLTFEEEVVVEKGLQPGERVVTDGQMRLFPGAKVDIKSPAEPGAAK